MPFIRGRYYANPIAGGAIEAAREAENALRVPHGSRGDEIQEHNDADEGHESKPLSKIEIELAELVPAHSGHAEHGYVARLHHRGSDATGDSGQSANKHVFFDPEQLVTFLRNELAKNGARR
jgi:hypothetical protein